MYVSMYTAYSRNSPECHGDYGVCRRVDLHSSPKIRLLHGSTDKLHFNAQCLKWHVTITAINFACVTLRTTIIILRK